jgi:hypothetical protein
LTGAESELRPFKLPTKAAHIEKMPWAASVRYGADRSSEAVKPAVFLSIFILD